MARRSCSLVAFLLAALALLAPLVAVADSCPDCGPLQSCCLSQGCPCCLAGSSVLTAGVRVSLGSAPTAIVGDPPAGRRLSADPRDVFHVPKLTLA